MNEGCSVQTDITMRDFSPNRLFIYNPASNVADKEIPLRHTETRDVLPKRNFYKEHLQNEVLDWLRNVPMFFSLNFTTKDIKDIVVCKLVDRINALTPEVHDETYEMKTKLEIDDCFSKLPMWLHGTRQEQILFKDCLKEKLWNKIKGLNKSFLGVHYEEDSVESVKSDDLSYEQEMFDWSLKLLLDPSESVTRKQVVDLLMKKLSPLLAIRLHTTSYKLILKGEIIDILDDLPLIFTSPRYKTVQLNKLAEDLANRLLHVQLKKGAPSPKSSEIISPSLFHMVTSQVAGRPMPRSFYNYKNIVSSKVGECLDKVPICNRKDLKKEICSAFLDSNLCKLYGINIKDEISQFLQDTGRISLGRAQIVANMIIQNVNEGLDNARRSTSTSFDSAMSRLSGTISVYRWGSETPPATSTPKKGKKKKEVPKLNPEETAYLEKVAALVTQWMNNLPKQFNEDPGFKNTVIYDLAGDLMDHQKLQQLAPDSVMDKEKYQKYLIYKWLCKFSFFEEHKLRTDSVPLVAQFQKNLNNIPVPNLTASQHGTRQEMGAIKHMEAAGAWDEDYVAKGIDVIEDQISVWVNEQPPDVIANKDKGKRNKMVHDLALKLQDHLRNKDSESAIEADINQWLKKMVNAKEKEHIKLLTQDLKGKVIDLPQDKTLEARHDERHREIVAKIAAKRLEQQGELPPQRDEDVSNLGNIQGDPDKTIREFIGKYIEHNYDIDDPLARGAFAHLLKTELRKLTAPTRKEVYEHFDQAKEHQRFRPDSLNYELEYIKVISDWLNSIPIDPSYNTVGNKRRIEFVNDLARNMIEIEEQRNDDPDAMDYNYLMASTILTSMNTYDLPIPREHMDDTPMMAHRLLEKLVDLRPAEVCCPQVSQGSDSLSSSIIAPDINEQNLSDFINDYIRINGRDIADDELKLEAWTTRLLKEIKKMVNEGADPQTLTKAQVYEKFAGVPIPNEESVETFGLKLHYVKEITDWMKNLPLLPMQPEQAEERVQMISELSEKMCDTEALRRANGDNSGDKQLEQYISTWISQLPLDRNKEINKPILIQQLMSRMAKGNKQYEEVDKSKTASITSSTSGDSTQKNKKKSKESKEKDSKKDSKRCSMAKSPSAKSCKGKTPAEDIIEAIETWSNKLPIKLDNKETVKTMKEGIARQLYQKIGELNVDPRIFNDELLYREMLDDEIETQLENVPQNSELQNNREKIKEGLINQIINTNQVIKEKSAGDNYRHKLETTIDASIPNPVQSVQAFDPGFEIYKNHLADMFILENFDHANDDVKAAHEKRVRHEIDKYFESAQNKNAVPLTKDQIYNEIYSALFKVPMPQENSVIDEVEQVKTRCEIDAWYEKLPIQSTDNLNELLERDQILSTLAKRIQEIEKYGCYVDDNINKETRKWLEKLPLKPGQQGIDEHVKQLQSLLKSTAEARKYVPPEAATKGKSKAAKQGKGKKGVKGANTSQVPGPSDLGAKAPRPKSSVLQSKATTAKPCCPPVGSMPNKKPGDLIVEVVEEWCDQLPLISTDENNEAIKKNVATRIVIQISQFNADAEIFNDDIVYDELLDEELDNVLSNLPVCCDFENTKAARKYQLKEQIKAIKPLIKEEKARHDYKQELNSTVASILKEPHDTSAEKLATFNKLTEEIVENFVQYYYDINDEEAAHFYKLQVHDAVLKFCNEVKEQVGTGDKVDPLVRRNQLLCELQRIPVPQSALKEEVAEIKMKKEVEQFLNEQSIPEGDAKDKMTKNLAKRLCDIEKTGYSPPNENKMKADILRGVTKLKKDVSPETVTGFVNKLKQNESERNAPPITSSQASNLNQVSPVQDSSGFQKPRTHYQAGAPMQRTCQTPKEMLGMPRPPAMPQATYHTPVSMHAYAPQVWGWSPNEGHPDQKLSQGPVGNFGGGNFLCSSPNAPRVQTPAHLTSIGGPMNLNKSLGSAVPRLSQQVMNRSCPQYQHTPRIREATSDPLSRPTFGQTPRQVRQSPTAPEPISVRDITSDSMFDEPVFNPVRYSLIEPFKSAAGSGKKGIRKLLADLDPRGIPAEGRPKVHERRLKGVESSDGDEDELCICDICAYGGNRRRIPYCLMPMMDRSFEDCLGFPMMYSMHFPDCFYY